MVGCSVLIGHPRIDLAPDIYSSPDLQTHRFPHTAANRSCASPTGEEGQKHCPYYGGAQTAQYESGVCCDNCVANSQGKTVCCNAGEQLCDGPGSDSTACCPPGDPDPSVNPNPSHEPKLNRNPKP